MNLKACTREQCSCCSAEYIVVPLHLEDLMEGEDREPALHLTIPEAKLLHKKLTQLAIKHEQRA